MRALATVSLLLVACAGHAPEAPPAPPPLGAPFETVEVPRALCGDAIEAELRARPFGIPTCGEGADLRFVRARAGARDVVVIAIDDMRPTADDGPVEHHACLVIDGGLRGARCDESEGAIALDDALGVLAPATDADARALLRAAVLLDRRSPNVAFDVATRDALAATAGPLGDSIREVDVTVDATGLVAVAGTFDTTYCCWNADVTTYDASIDSGGHVSLSTLALLRADGASGVPRPWEGPHPPPAIDLGALDARLGSVVGRAATP